MVWSLLLYNGVMSAGLTNGGVGSAWDSFWNDIHLAVLNAEGNAEGHQIFV